MRRALSATAARSLFHLLIVVLPGLLWPRSATTEAFLVHHHHHYRHSQQQWRPPPHDDNVTGLCAKKKAGSAAARNINSSNPKAAGFGAAPAAADNRQKLRSVSGRGVGAGSKPLRQAALAFDRLRKEYGVAACRDVYVRSPLNSPTTFWYVGKVAFCPDDSSSGGTSSDGVSACLSQKRVILEYSRQQLRPQNMDGKYAAALELWLAPGDSEMDVVQNKVSLQPVRGSAADLPDDFTVETVGYNPEVYVGDEVTKGGLRVELSEEGHPVRPPFEVNQSA